MRKQSKVFVVAVATVVVVSGGLTAQVGAIEQVVESGFLTPNAQNVIDVSCPANQKVLGGGAVADPTFGKAVIVSSRPKFDDGWEGVVDAGSPNPANALTVKAICQGGKVASKLKYRERAFGIDPGSVKTKAVGCPDGYKVTGGGVAADGTFNATEVEGTRPVDGGTAWEGRVRNLSANPDSMTVYAICATGRFARKLVYLDKSETAEAGNRGERNTNCPAGSKVTGGGSLVKNAAAALIFSDPDTDSRFRTQVDAIGGDAPFKTYAVCKT